MHPEILGGYGGLESNLIECNIWLCCQRFCGRLY